MALQYRNFPYVFYRSFEGLNYHLWKIPHVYMMSFNMDTAFFDFAKSKK
ncbi:hypothetical protein KDH_79590 [Dictyobacter sp. S3.2.2.5]|uniref:Uncharacterized protein n=1 Tax=Dictyobacter halimunensis TaxID=3026934 RepID=A0ABQ6G5J1_9CHLR|nr:hypothetical protein KDH_79590 [Dictyobacter sp. S3.2.2.5]